MAKACAGVDDHARSSRVWRMTTFVRGDGVGFFYGVGEGCHVYAALKLSIAASQSAMTSQP